MKHIVGNWKQNKTPEQAIDWLEAFDASNVEMPDAVSIVIAAPFTLLPMMHKYIQANDLPLSLASQDISPFEEGAFTGEIGANQLVDFVEHVVIGHSERRMYFGDTNQMVAQKVQQAVANGLHAFVCIADQVTETGQVPEEKIEVDQNWFKGQITSVFSEIGDDLKDNITLVYEPISAISTFGGEPLTSQQAVDAIKMIKEIAGEDVDVMYGGSVNPDNITTYWPHAEVAGVMPGGASLEVETFLSMVSQC